MRNFNKTVILCVISLLVFAGCGGPKQLDQSSFQPMDNGKLFTGNIPEIEGPKRTVAVGKFDAVGSFVQKYGNWNIGGGLSAMLTTALMESQRFIVVERANLGQIMTEQKMKSKGLSHQRSGPETGLVIGTNFLIYGSVTEFSTADKGGGFSFGLGFGLDGDSLSTGVGNQSTRGKMTIDIRIVNATSSEVIEVYTVSKDIKTSGWNLSVGYNEIEFGSNTFMKTPLGQASREAVNTTVELIAAKVAQIPWSGSVVDYEGDILYINTGSKAGVKVGDGFIIEKITRKFSDPATGKVISTKKENIGTVIVTNVEKNMSYGMFQKSGRYFPSRGDIVSAKK